MHIKNISISKYDITNNANVKGLDDKTIFNITKNLLKGFCIPDLSIV